MKALSRRLRTHSFRLANPEPPCQKARHKKPFPPLEEPFMPSADIGLIGLAVMGSNLALNIAEKGYTIAVHNRTASKIDEFMVTAREQGLDGRCIPEADLV